MIRVVTAELAAAETAAVLRPVTAEWAAPTPAMRRLELAAGPEVEAHCRRLGELPVGSAVVTPGGGLRAGFLVHVVIRSVDRPVSVEAVRRGLRNGLRRLAEWGLESVALPPLGTGAGNLDAEDAADAMVPVLRAHMAEAAHPARIEIHVETDYERAAFERALGRPVPPIESSVPPTDP
jgi:O-acetyl-ADP-ribose deacetylase (regulator of RNase III)